MLFFENRTILKSDDGDECGQAMGHALQIKIDINTLYRQTAIFLDAKQMHYSTHKI